MPSQEKTQSLGLNQWMGNEYVKRQDFVEDNMKIDEAFGVLEGKTQTMSDSIEAQGLSLCNINTAIDELETDFVVHKADSTAHGTASQTEAQAGTSNEKYMTPLRTKEALDKFAPSKYLGEVVDFNNALSVGNYSVAHTGSGLANAPFTGNIYGRLEVATRLGTTFNDTQYIWQTFYPHDIGGNVNPAFYIRSKITTNAWGTWLQFKSNPNVDNVKQMPMLNVAATTDDPDTVLRGYMVTNHANSPSSSYYWHIQTFFHSSVAIESNRCQIAVKYNGGLREMWIRHHFQEIWQPWTKLVNANGDTFTGEVAFGRNLLTAPQIKNYTETIFISGVGASVSVNLNYGNVHRYTLTSNVTFTFDNPATSGQCHSLTLIVTQPATAVSIIFPASVRWANGTIPAVPTANKTAVYTFFTFDGGTKWIGSQAISEVTL